MDKFYDANYRITDFRTENGKIVDLEINNKHIDLSNYDENKIVKVTENGRIEIVPSKDKNGMKKVTVTTDVHNNLYAWKHSTDLIYSLEVPTFNKTLDIFVSENKSEVIGHTLHIREYANLEKDVGDYLLNKIRYKEQDYIRSSEDDIRI